MYNIRKIILFFELVVTPRGVLPAHRYIPSTSMYMYSYLFCTPICGRYYYFSRIWPGHVSNPKCVYNVYIIIKANPFGQSQNAAVTANGPALCVFVLYNLLLFAHHLQRQPIRPDDDDGKNLFKLRSYECNLYIVIYNVYIV